MHNEGTRDRRKHQATFVAVVRRKNEALPSLRQFVKKVVPELVPKKKRYDPAVPRGKKNGIQDSKSVPGNWSGEM